MNKRFFALSLLFVLLCQALNAAVEPNIVIESHSDYYKFIPDKNGNLLKVESSSESVYRARRTDDVATAVAVYDSFNTVDKASGGEVSYRAHESGSVFYNDSKVCRVDVPLKKGGTGKASFKMTNIKPQLFTAVMIYDLYDIENATVTFEIPAALDSRYTIVPHNIPEGMMTSTVEQKGNKVLRIFKFKDVRHPKSFADAPSLSATLPRLRIMGYFEDVNALYRHLYTYLPLDDPNHAEVEAKARELTAGCTTDAGRIKAIYDYVHKSIRYIAIEHGDYGHRPELPSKVLSDRFGDCKGSATLLQAMLKAVGIDARHGWIGTRSIKDDWTDVPNMSTGNHMIACAFTGDSILYLDGTQAYHPLNVVPFGISGKQVIIEDTPDRCVIARVPAVDPASNGRRMTVDLTRAEGNDLRADVRMTLTGENHFMYRSAIAGLGASRHDDFKHRLLSAAIGNMRPDGVEAEVTETETILSGSGTMAARFTTAGDELYLDLNPAGSLGELKFDLDERTCDGELLMPCVDSVAMNFMLPDDLAVADTPADVEVSNRWIDASVKTVVAADGRSLSRLYEMKIKDVDIPLGSLAGFNADINRLFRVAASKVVLKKIK